MIASVFARNRSSAPACSAACVLVLLACLASSIHAQQAAEELAGLTGAAADAVLVPETQPVGAAAAGPATATAAAIQPQHAETTVAVRMNTRRQAMAASRKASPNRPILAGNAPLNNGSLGSQAICGGNSLVADNQVTNCRIVSTYSGGASSCSAVKIGDRLLATAGHCLYSKPSGGWAQSIDVYCTGSVACGGQRTTYATHITTTKSWMASPTNIPTAWDGAVIKTAGSLPGRTLPLGQFSRTGSYRVALTGYPAQSGDPGCGSSAYAGACYQYTSTDNMDVTPSDMYSSSNLDLCSGHSGSGVMTADAGRYVVAVVSGASFSPCANYFVPQINSNGGVNSDCEKPQGGVSFACLASKLPA